MRILVTPTFERAVKKLHKQQKAALDESVRAIVGQPEASETKVSDLAGNTLKLLMVGPQENFYRDLKRTEP